MTNTRVPYEIGPNYRPGGIVLVGDFPGPHGDSKGRVSEHAWNALLNDALAEAGIRRSDIAFLNVCRFPSFSGAFRTLPRGMVESELRELHSTLANLAPNLVVALGSQAAFAACDGDWPSKDGSVFGAFDADSRRGYLFDGFRGLKTLVTVHPADAHRSWVPFRTLLSYDLQKAKANASDGHLRRPQRTVEIVSSTRDARLAVDALRRHGKCAVDIENYDERELACVGFAGERGRAFVFPTAQLNECRPLLEDARIGKVFQNGQYDTYFLLTRNGIRVAGRLDDTLLQWHAMYPELAGAGEKAGGKRKTKRTHKSLAFLASLYTTDAWWKDYDFATEEERYILNGKDCCLTLEIFERQDPQVDALGVRSIYEHEISLIWPCVMAQTRGMRVDDALRRERIAALEARYSEDRAKLQEIVVPLLEREREKLEDAGLLRLFEQKEGVCPCCRHAAKKQQACWSCAGFEKAPSKADLVKAGGDPALKKEELEATLLSVCRECKGAERKEWLEFNPDSVPQKQAILFDLLKLPKRFKQGKLTTDEEAIKSLLGAIA